MNSGDKNKVSGKLADEGLWLICVGIRQWRQNTPVFEMEKKKKTCARGIFAITVSQQRNVKGNSSIKNKHSSTATNE